MPKLTDSTGGPTIGVNEESQVFRVDGRHWNLYVTGTPSTSTLTLKWCRTEDGTFVTYAYEDVTGATVNFTISASQVASSSIGFRRVLVDSGMFFKFVADANGTPAWQIDVNGDHVTTIPTA